MSYSPRISTVWLVASVAWVIPLLLIAGCDASPGGAPSPQPTPVVDSVPITDTITAATATPYATTAVDVVDTPAAGATSAAIPATGIQLTMWTIESVSPDAEGEAGAALASGLQAFERRYPSISVSVKIKNDSGKGGVLDYLRSASSVAPSVLPDVVVLDTTELAGAARAGVLVAMDGLAAPALINDLLPGARISGTFDGQLVGMPFDADAEHIVFSTSKVATAPLTWQDVLSASTTYRFPAKGRNGLVNDSLLIQYFAAGGRLTDEDGAPLLDEPTLATVLEYYRLGVEKGTIPGDVLTAADTEDLWGSYVAGETGIVHVRASRFLQARNLVRGSQYANVPTKDGKPLTIVRGRALAITTRNPMQAMAAMRLIEWMMEPDHAAVWHQTTDTLPTRYATFQRMGDDPYWEFLRHTLETAVPPPSFPQYDQVGRVLQQAVVEVVGGDSTPQDAATAAVDVIGR